MENCLVTKLKGSVNNPALVKLGHYRVEMISMTEPYWITTVGCVVSLVSGNAKAYSNSGEEISFPVSCAPKDKIRFVSTNENETFVLDATNKYTEGGMASWITWGKPLSLTFQDLEEFPEFTVLAIRNSSEALHIDFAEEVAAGHSYPKYTSVDMRFVITNGDITKIPLLFPNTEGTDNGIVPGPSLYGAIEDLIRSWRSIGKTTGTFKINGWVRNENITFNNHVFSANYYDNPVVSWTSNTMTVTYKNGDVDTINE